MEGSMKETTAENSVKMSENVASKLAELKNTELYQEETASDFIKSNTSGMKENPDTHSCKQVCTPIPCLPHDCNIVYCFVLSVWDNVIGPQTLQVWKRETKVQTSSSKSTSGQSSKKASDAKEKTEDVQSKTELSTGTNAGESIQEPSSTSSTHPSSPVTLRSGDGGSGEANQSTVGGQKSKPKPDRLGSIRLQSIVRYVTEHTVTLAQVSHQPVGTDVESEQPSPTIMIIPQHGIIIQALRFLVREDDMLVPHCLSMVVSQKEETQLLQVSSLSAAYLTRLLRKLRLLLATGELHGIGDAVKPHLQELCWVLVSLRLHSLSRYPLLPSGQPPSDRQLALKLLTSHLCTAGYTVIVGDKCTAVNSVLLWLGQFLRPAELHLSRLCWDPCYNQLQPGLFLQGIVSSSKRGVSAERLLQFGRPVTLCDLDARTVARTIVFSAGGAPHNKEVLKEATAIAGLVRQFFRECELLASHSSEVRAGYSAAFVRCLQYRALALITFVRHNRQEPSAKMAAKLQAVLQLDEPSLAVVLAVAEQLQPGVSNLVSGLS